MKKNTAFATVLLYAQTAKHNYTLHNPQYLTLKLLMNNELWTNRSYLDGLIPGLGYVSMCYHRLYSFTRLIRFNIKERNN